MNYALINNTTAKQYEIHVGEFMPKIEYILSKQKIFLTHTEVPKQLEGQGVGTQLVKQVLEDIKEQDLTLVPLCPFVALYIKRNPEWRELVMKGVTIK